MGRKEDVQLRAAKVVAIDKLKSRYKSLAKEPVSVNGILWNGGDISAGAINGAIALARAAGETDVTLWDYNDVNHANMSFADASTLAAQIALTYRAVLYGRNDIISAINAALSVDAVNAIFSE